MWPLVELEQTFSQTSHKGAHLNKMEHFPSNWVLDNFDSCQLFAFCHLRHCKGKRDDPYPGNLFYLEERILRKWGKGRWVKYKKITSFSSLHFSKSGTVKFSPMRQVRSTWQNVYISGGKIWNHLWKSTLKSPVKFFQEEELGLQKSKLSLGASCQIFFM